jgi:hypothetical protein
MKILFDNGTPKPIARSLRSHQISYARQIVGTELENSGADRKVLASRN